MPILEVKNLKTFFYTHAGVVKAVDDVSFSVEKGETIGLVGESGCGKSVMSLSIMRLIANPPGRIVSGEIFFQDEHGSRCDLLRIPEAGMRRIRGKRIAMIFQEPMTSLNPVFTVGNQIAEVMELHEKLSKAEIRNRTIEMLKIVGIPSPETKLNDYPHQMSGGMRQRIMIAMALACRPSILIADEPTTALDVTIQAQILELMKELQERFRMTLILITHDFGVVAGIADRVAVMYAGKIVEEASVAEIFERPQHPYTIGLMKSIPPLDKQAEGSRLATIPGVVPDLITMPNGCIFADRCSKVRPGCREKMPDLFEAGERHTARCYYPG